ncbi:MAG: hypothetical protein N2663_03385 [Chlorobi bacterium]|nr:hypothetical protein [Chlorobiota bacterium]
MQLRSIVAAAVVCTAVAAAQRLELSGRILDGRSNPPVVAHAELRRAGRIEPIVQVRANADGSFAIATEGSGLFLLRVAAVHHAAVEIPFLVSDRIVRERVTIQLPTLPFPDRRDSVLLVQQRALPQTTAGVPLVLRDGIYTVPKGAHTTQRYRIAIRGGGRGIVTASVRDSLVLEPDGYYSGIPTDSTVIFDPAQLPRPNMQCSIRCESVAWQEVADAYLALTSYQRVLMDSSNALMDRIARAGGVGYDPTHLHTVLGADRWRDTITARLATVRSPVAEQLWLLFALTLPARGQNDQLHRRAVQQIPPSSPLWALDPQLLFVALSNHSDNERRSFLDELIESNPDTTVRAVVAFTELVSASTSGDRERARMMYTVLTKRCPTHPLTQTAARYNPDRRIRIGAPLPEFRLPAKQKGATISQAQLLGKPALVAVVFDGCQPCTERLEELVVWLDSTKRSLPVLVVSIGAPSGELARVLQRIPHTLAIVSKFNSPELEPFEIEGFPLFVLCDAKGTIKATTQELRNLRTDVGRYLDMQP